MLETFTLDQLRLYLAVVDEGSFSAAGRKLGRVQSAVSQGIANLEASLGVALFDRRGRLPRLTPTGDALLHDARQVFAGVSQLRTRAAVIARGLEPEVAVAVDAIVPARVLIAMCRGFQAKFPTVSLRLATEVVDAVADLVLDGTCHLGIAGPASASGSSITSRFLMHVELVPVVGPEHALARRAGPIPTAAVRNHIQVVISGRSRDKGSDHGVLSAHTWRVADAVTKLALIKAGLGWGNLPTELVRDELESGALVQLELEEWGPEPVRANLATIVRTDAPPGPAGQWLLSHLDGMCNELSSSGA